MASLNDVLKEVLEKDFDEKDVERVVNPEEDTTQDERAKAEAEQDDQGDSYVGPGDYVQNSIGRSAVESFMLVVFICLDIGGIRRQKKSILFPRKLKL